MEPAVDTHAHLDFDRLAEDLRARGKQVVRPADLEALVTSVVALARPGDVILSMSNGAFGGVNARLREALG